MKRLPLPVITGQVSYRTCISGVEDHRFRERLALCEGAVTATGIDYVNRGNQGALWTIPPVRSIRNEDPVILGDVKKSELVKLYDYYLVQKQPARDIYDTLLVSANDKCPFCGGIGRPKTLDHYLPKANFPQYSVFPPNLLPACRDCNTGKSNECATSNESQVLHPYLDDDQYFNQQWVYASVEHTQPCSVTYYVLPPVGWDDVSKHRVRNHFEKFDLAKRYSIQSGEELSIILHQRATFMADFSPERFSAFLQSAALSSTLFINHWKKILYQALANDAWFCSQV